MKNSEIKIEVVTKQHAEEFLRFNDLLMGDWGEICAIDPNNNLSINNTLDASPLDLYVASNNLSKWLLSGSPKKQILFHLDNSTFASEDEEKIFSRFLLSNNTVWNSRENRTILFEALTENAFNQNNSVITLSIYFSLVFEWHVYLVGSPNIGGKRLALRDAVISFLGSDESICGAQDLIQLMECEPKKMLF